MTNLVPLRRALLSVSDKTGLIDLGRALAARGVELLSTGGTAHVLRAAGMAVEPPVGALPVVGVELPAGVAEAEHASVGATAAPLLEVRSEAESSHLQAEDSGGRPSGDDGGDDDKGRREEEAAVSDVGSPPWTSRPRPRRPP